MSKRHELLIELGDRTTGALVVQERLLIAPGERVDLQMASPFMMRVLMREMQRSAMSRQAALYQGVKAHFVDTDPNGDVRNSMEYIKGFNDGADTTTEAADRILGRLVSYLRSQPWPHESKYIPGPKLTHLQDVCDQAMREWIDYKKGK